ACARASGRRSSGTTVPTLTGGMLRLAPARAATVWREPGSHLLTRFQSAQPWMRPSTGQYFRPMREDSGHVDASVLASSTAGPRVLAATAAPTDSPVVLPRLSSLRLPSGLRWPHADLGPRA